MFYDVGQSYLVQPDILGALFRLRVEGQRKQPTISANDVLSEEYSIGLAAGYTH